MLKMKIEGTPGHKSNFHYTLKRCYTPHMKKEDLIGKWKIRREISAPDGTSKGRMWGSGFFDMYDGAQLLYQEQMCHEMQNEELLLATKFYRYHFMPEQLSIYFYQEEEGRLFMTLPILDRELKGHAECKSDSYFLQWNWINPDCFLMSYSISGPKKNIIIESEFKR